MDQWTLHWLSASGDLGNFRSEILSSFETAYQKLSELLMPPRLDIIIERRPGETIPEMGIVGYTHRETLVAMSLDPDNPNFVSSLEDGALCRQILHEIHHAMRWVSPGYSHTLGEALVSEGLAGQFVGKLLGTAPEPWERALEVEDLLKLPVDLNDLSSTDYEHAEWFYGSGSLHRWTGYTLGYHMVHAWMSAAGKDASLKAFITVPASEIISAALSAGLIKHYR